VEVVSEQGFGRFVRSIRVRALPLVFLVACSKDPAAAPAPSPSPAVAPATPPVATPVKTAPPPDPIALAARCPVGDNTHVAVYGFLEREIEERNKGDRGRAAAKKLLAEEAELLKKPDMKPHAASIVESETSHVLTTLCAGAPGCKAIGLYTKSGVAIALSSQSDTIAPYGFDDDAWAKFSTTNEGETVELGGNTFIVFPTAHGFATCIIDK
jgi:hypothetical protein